MQVEGESALLCNTRLTLKPDSGYPAVLGPCSDTGPVATTMFRKNVANLSRVDGVPHFVSQVISSEFLELGSCRPWTLLEARNLD